MTDGEPGSSEKKPQEKAPLPAPIDLKEMVEGISPEAIKSIPADDLEKLKNTKAILVSSERHTHTELSVTHCGPLPPPSYLAKYNETIPQGADRIMKQAEAQSAHRIEIERKVVSDQAAR